MCVVIVAMVTGIGVTQTLDTARLSEVEEKKLIATNQESASPLQF
jgi:hypothetical protein